MEPIVTANAEAQERSLATILAAEDTQPLRQRQRGRETIEKMSGSDAAPRPAPPRGRKPLQGSDEGIDRDRLGFKTLHFAGRRHQRQDRLRPVRAGIAILGAGKRKVNVPARVLDTPVLGSRLLNTCNARQPVADPQMLPQPSCHRRALGMGDLCVRMTPGHGTRPHQHEQQPAQRGRRMASPGRHRRPIRSSLKIHETRSRLAARHFTQYGLETAVGQLAGTTACSGSVSSPESPLRNPRRSRVREASRNYPGKIPCRRPSSAVGLFREPRERCS